MDSVAADLIALCHRIGDPANDLVIASEGNVSLRSGQDSFWIKGSGECMKSISESGICEMKIGMLVKAIEEASPDLVEHRRLLNSAQISEGIRQPSTESYMHAALMEITGCHAVVHTHPTPVLTLLSLYDTELQPEQRLFPDEVVQCGPATCLVGYVMPGLPLAAAIIQRIRSFRERFGVWPKTLWLQNHGLICIGNTPAEAEAATLMAAKAARVILGAMQTGKEIHWLSRSAVDAIANWPDEHYRQNRLWSQE